MGANLEYQKRLLGTVITVASWAGTFVVLSCLVFFSLWARSWRIWDIGAGTLYLLPFSIIFSSVVYSYTQLPFVYGIGYELCSYDLSDHHTMNFDRVIFCSNIEAQLASLGGSDYPA